MSIVNKDASYSHHTMAPDGNVPNNLSLPVLYYKHVLQSDAGEQAIKNLFSENGWKDSWTGDIYTYHHYHSTAHEVLAVLSGNCMVELGGDDGNIQKVQQGDVLVLPAGVAHKNVGASADFKCIGAYPEGQQYDMNYCKPEELEAAVENISKVPLPAKDPVFGEQGALVELWRHEESEKFADHERQF
ncbi:cupin domain-containing protein [Aridibaculum aurantiacum]|uniref:cupin domain-containing protein n=1 Tax=Aridibaculum aurantiacum TaxID=2810307 RepID=UPI001A97D319|nr:cupin domain-containing protein [Aridibaculum aurantiacum]